MEIYFDGKEILFIGVNTIEYDGGVETASVIPMKLYEVASYGWADGGNLFGTSNHMDVLDMKIGDVIEAEDWPGAYLMRIA